MLLEGIYILAKILVLYIQRLYYKDPIVINESFAQIDKPTILVTNHPNTLLDAIFGAATVSAQVKFLANYSLFKSKLGNWFFSTFYCIPVQRPEDVNEGKTNNEHSLARSQEFLADGGTLYIASEGYSIQTLGIRPLKTGAARLALSTESEKNWQANIQILPIGLNYEKADRFRSNLVIHVGKPYSIREKADAYYQDPKETTKEVTSELEDNMRSILLDADDTTTWVLKSLRSYWKWLRPTDAKREYLRARMLLVNLKKVNHEVVKSLYDDIQSFETQAKGLKVDGKDLAKAIVEKDNPIRLSNLIVALPITIIGFFTNIIPYILCHWIEQKGNKSIVYSATFRIVAGMILFPIMYLFWMWLVSYYTHSVILTLLSLLVYRRSGIYAWHQFQNWKRYFKTRRIEKEGQHLFESFGQIISKVDDIVL